MEDYYAENQPQVSKYNEAGLQILRLHEFWLKAEDYANNGNLPRWKFILDSVWRELYPDVKKRGEPEWIKNNSDHKEKIADSKNLAEFYNALNKRHEFLKFIQDSVGKGGTYGDQYDEDPE